MKLWRWEKGRQNTGYQKLLLLGSNWFLRFDLYILKFETGVEIPSHTDRVETGEHYRLNIVLKEAKKGGKFVCEECIYETPRIKLFRPDLFAHSVTKVVSGERYVLSLGWVKGV